MTQRKIEIDSSYQPPSVNRWTPEDDLVQKLYAPMPIEKVRREPMAITTVEAAWLIALVVVAHSVLYILFAL